MDCSAPGFLVHHQLPQLTQTHVHQVGDSIQSSHPLLFSLLLPSIFPRIRDFSNEKVLHIRWPKNWSLNFSISPSNDYSGLISFRMDWLDLFVVQGSLKSILQHKRSKASILWRSAFFMVQLSHPYIITGKTIALTRQTFAGKVTSLIFNILSSFSSEEQASFNFMAVVTICSDFGVQENKSVTVSIVSPCICH